MNYKSLSAVAIAALLAVAIVFFTLSDGFNVQEPVVLGQSASQERTNLAQGQPVWITPAPNGHIADLKNNPALLTNSKITKKGSMLWKGGQSIGWRSAGRVNIAVDLGQLSHVEEVAFRLQGDAGGMPGWIEIVASKDGKHWTRLAQVSRFEPNYRKKIARITGTSKNEFIINKPGPHLFRFKKIDVDARWIGIRMYTSAVATGVTDELYAWGTPLSNTASPSALKGKAAGFSVKRPQVYFNKPRMKLLTNIAAPLPVSVVPAARKAKDKSNAPLTVTFFMPPGVELLSGRLGPRGNTMTVEEAQVTTLGDGTTKYHFTVPEPTKMKRLLGRLYVQATGWSDGQTGTLRYQFGQSDWQSKIVSVPVQAVRVPKAPQLETIMTGLGWWAARWSMQWPHVLDAFRQIGLNTFPVRMNYFTAHNGPPLIKPGYAAFELMRKAQKKGFYISGFYTSSPFLQAQGLKKASKQYHFNEEGQVGTQIDPSYHGKYYQQAVDRFAKTVARVNPDFLAMDVEEFHRVSLKVYKQCTRCQRLFQKSDFETWNEWRLSLGDKLWQDFIGAARRALKKAGKTPDFQIGMYALRPGVPYGHITSFNHLYPDYFDYSMPHIYGAYYGSRLVKVGNIVRQDRKRLPESDIMPWLTPGDTGIFPGHMFKWALLESYANGARGIWFWSGKMWDAEDLIAYNKVIRAIAPVEDVIVKGELAGDAAKVLGPGRISGMKRNGEMLLLVADYEHETDGKVKLKLDLPANVVVTDLLKNGKKVAELKSGHTELVVPLNGKKARLLHIELMNR